MLAHHLAEVITVTPEGEIVVRKGTNNIYRGFGGTPPLPHDKVLSVARNATEVVAREARSRYRCA
jgi:hypothetical protein